MRRALLFLSLSLGSIIGLVVYDTTQSLNFIFFIIGLLLIINIFLPRYQIVVFLLCFGILIGGWRYWQIEVKQLNLKPVESIIFTGIIIDEVEYNISKQRVVFQSSNIMLNKKINILVILPLYPEVDFGQIWQLTGDLKLPESFIYKDNYGREIEFAYDEYLKLKHIDYVMYYPANQRLLDYNQNIILHQNYSVIIKKYLFQLKNNLTEKLDKILPEPHAAFVSAILWGSRNALDETVKENFRRAGLSHIVALSGFNISIIALALMQLAPYLYISRRWAIILTILIISCFVIFTGAQSSIIRAALMGSGSIIAYQLGRRASALILLLVSGTAMTLINPLILLHDIGFQLSFLATLGLLLFSRSVENWLEKIPNWFALRLTVSATLAATLATLPILIMYFGRISIVSLLANIAIVPVIPALMLFSFLGLFIAYIVPDLAAGCVLITFLISIYIIKFSGWLASLHFAEIKLPFLSSYVVMIIYLIFGVILFFMNKKDLIKLKRYLE